jgi:UDP-glucuronate decarboxylase
MRILVTGAAGFLGSHLSESLLEQGHDVLAVDNLYTGSLKNIQHLFSNPSFQFLKHDITSPLFIDVDQIYNLACPASPVHYQRNPVQTIKTNIQGAINVLDLAKRTGAKVLQASTSEVYGDPLIPEQDEEYWGNVNPIGIRACYDEGKRAAETLFFDYWRQFGIQIKVARIFNTYGPRMDLNDGRVVSNFAVQALMGEPLTIYGDGSQTRSFCYVTDLIPALILLMETSIEITGPINLGNPKEFTMLELANQIISSSSSKSEITFESLPADDPKQRKPDITRARRILGWEPGVELEIGLERTIQYFADRLRESQNS